MVNPNICKRVDVIIDSKALRAKYKGVELDIVWYQIPKNQGKRRLYLKFSILLDSYYLTDRS